MNSLHRISKEMLVANYASLGSVILSLVMCMDGLAIDDGVSALSETIRCGADMGVVVVADVELRQLLRVNEMDLGDIEHNRIVDLNEDGSRWEGDVLHDEPFGWGVLYDGNNRVAYEGFRIGSRNVCFGRRYYADIARIEYEGEWCRGMRWGRGVQYNRKGDVVYDGKWVSNEHLETKVVVACDQSQSPLHCCIEELVIGSNCFNNEELRLLDLSLIPALRSLSIGDYSFEDVEIVNIVGLNHLESVVVGNYCFKDREGRFFLKHCPSVKRLKTGRFSFPSYRVCEIEDVPALEVIEMGSLKFEHVYFCFGRASLELKSILIHSE